MILDLIESLPHDKSYPFHLLWLSFPYPFIRQETKIELKNKELYYSYLSFWQEWLLSRERIRIPAEEDRIIDGLPLFSGEAPFCPMKQAYILSLLKHSSLTPEEKERFSKEIITNGLPDSSKLHQ